MILKNHAETQLDTARIRIELGMHRSDTGIGYQSPFRKIYIYWIEYWFQISIITSEIILAELKVCV